MFKYPTTLQQYQCKSLQMKWQQACLYLCGCCDAERILDWLQYWDHIGSPRISHAKGPWDVLLLAGKVPKGRNAFIIRLLLLKEISINIAKISNY